MRRRFSRVIVAAMLVGGAAGAAGCESIGLKRAASLVELHEDYLGPYDGGFVEASRDGVHVARVVRSADTVRVVFDGRPGPELPAAGKKNRRLFPYLSLDGTRCAYRADVEGGQCVVVDGVAGPVFSSVGSIFLSRGIPRVAYAAGTRKVDGADSWQMVIDGQPGPAFDEIMQDRPFSPDGSRAAYAARTNNRWCVVVDGKAGPAYDKVGRLEFSPDGKHIAFLAERNGMECVVLDGQEGKFYADIGVPMLEEHTFSFSQEGGHLFYKASRGPQWFMVVDGQEGPPFDDMRNAGMGAWASYHCQFSPDGRHHAYAAARSVIREGLAEKPVIGVIPNPRDFVVLDGKIVGEYDYYSAMIYFVDNRLVFTAQRDGKTVLIFDGVEEPTFDPISNYYGYYVSHDSQHITYTGRQGGKAFVVHDGRRGPEYDEVAALQWPYLPDDSRYVYVGRRGTAWFFVEDGRERPVPGDMFVPTSWSPQIIFNEQHMAYAAKVGKKQVMIIDGKAGPEFDEVCGCRFSPTGHLAYIARNGKMWRVVVDGEEGPEFEKVYNPGFVRRGKSFEVVYVAQDAGKRFVVEGREPGQPADELRYPHPGGGTTVLGRSDDSAHWGCAARRDGRWVFILDGRTSPAYDRLLWGPLFRPDGTLEGLAARDGALFRVRLVPVAK